MSLEIEYERPYQRNEPESLQKCILKYDRYNIKSMYPEKINSSILDKYAKFFVPYTADCEYQLDFRCKEKDKPWRVTTTYHQTQDKNHKKSKNLRKMDIDSMKSIN